MSKNDYWFKRRRFGWGWTPTTWQGWLCVVLAVALIFANSLFLDTHYISWVRISLYAVNTVAIIIVLVLISYAKGPKPAWRWGKKPTDNSDEDI